MIRFREKLVSIGNPLLFFNALLYSPAFFSTICNKYLIKKIVCCNFTFHYMSCNRYRYLVQKTIIFLITR